MTQYPNEKGPHSEWLDPPKAQHGAPSGVGPQDYVAPQGPPPHYTYNQHQPTYDQDVKSPATSDRAPPPQAWPSSSSSTPSRDGNSSDGTMSLNSFFGNKGTPPMWRRPAPPQLPYPAFPPLCLLSNNKDLTDGFPVMPPPCALNPHPFATHDITEEDWKRFLDDVRSASKLTAAQRIKSNVIPLVTGMSFITGFLATNAIERKMKSKNQRAAGDLVDHWNHYFFGPRRMEVVLCQGSERLSGKMGPVPIMDPNQQRMAGGLRQRRRSASSSSSSSTSSSSSSSTSSDSSEDKRHGRQRQEWMSDRHARKAARRERRQQRREEKRARRDDRRDAKWQRREEKRARKQERRERKARGEDKLPYQLVITPI